MAILRLSYLYVASQSFLRYHCCHEFYRPSPIGSSTGTLEGRLYDVNGSKGIRHVLRRHKRQQTRIVSFSFLFLFLSLLPTTGLLAQAGKSTISGRVTDQSGAVLQGAQVSLDPKGVVVVSNVQGQFFINNLDPGSYTLTDQLRRFPIRDEDRGRGGRQDVTADSAFGFRPRAPKSWSPRRGLPPKRRPINIQRTADNIVQVLPAEVIRSLPNANMADALGRLPSVTLERDEGEGKYVQIRGTEPRLTNTTIDGINVPSPESGVRQIKFDAIPADIVECRRKSTRRCRPTWMATASGARVNLVTKTAGAAAR